MIIGCGVRDLSPFGYATFYDFNPNVFGAYCPLGREENQKGNSNLKYMLLLSNIGDMSVHHLK